MPGVTLPVTISASTNIRVIQHDTAQDFLSATYATLRHHEQSANMILAHALKKADLDPALADHIFTVDTAMSLQSSSSTPHSAESFWLTVWSPTTPSACPAVDVVLSCINWTLGDYPIFLWTPYHPSTLSPAWLNPRFAELVKHLRVCVCPRRVFSVFGNTSLVKSFTQYWRDLTGYRIEPQPFYAACYTFCTPQSIRAPSHTIPESHFIRPADLHDLDAVAQLCKEFADDSVSSILVFEI